MTDFYKDPGELESLNLSDISDIDPDEIEKIVKSAGELDNKYLGFGSSKSSAEAKDKNTTSKNRPDNILDQDNLPGENFYSIVKGEVTRTSGQVTRPSVIEDPVGYGLKFEENERQVERKPKSSSADWLGLKDSPVKQSSFDADDYMSLKPDPKHGLKSANSLEGKTLPSPKKNPVKPTTTITHLLSNEKSSRNIASPEKGLYAPPLPGDSPLTMSLKHKAATQINKNKGKLIDELFGEAKTAGEDSFKIGVGSEHNKDDSYLPSATTNRRLERRGASAPRPPSSGIDGDFDWLLGTKPATSKPKGLQTEPKPSPPTSALPPSTITQNAKSGQIVKESKMPDWLEGIIPGTPQKDSSPAAPIETSKSNQQSELHQWLDVKNKPAPNESQPTPSPQTHDVNQEALPLQVNVVTQPKIILNNDTHSNIAVKLASIQKELGEAIARRNENLQIYMQVLIQEAQRVGSIPDVSPSKNEENNLPKKEDNNIEDEENKVDKKEEIIKHQEDLIHDFEINISRLELQNTQLEMKIENLKSTHEMEIEMIKKNHGFEISAWEARLERMKTTFDENIEDYKRKVAKLKENEELLITEHKERIKKLEEDRLAELDKIKEFHEAALQHAATLTVPFINSQSTVRLPLKILNRPKDEVELSERESSLLEKERQLEVLKAVVEAEKKELDEALEVEKIRREEREREIRRQSTETKLREEARLSEAKREREQLDALSLQIKLMREEALKEQGELAKEKLELAAERARLEATYSIQGRSEGSIPPLDIMQARAEVDAALQTAREAKEAAELERRKQAEMRQAVEQITWEQKEMDLRLENREKHLTSMLKNAEKLRKEGLNALEEAKAMKEELDIQQKEIKEQLKQIETKERVLAKERLEIAKEKIEVERRRAQLDIILPELNPAEELTLNPSKVFVDPKAVIMRLKAEKEFESFMTHES